MIDINKEKVNIKVVRGVEGVTLYIDDYRIAGPKPWAGDTIIKEWDIDISEILVHILNEQSD